MLVKFGFWIPVFSRILDSLSCIPDSKAQDFEFNKQKFPRFQNPDFLDMGREEEAPKTNGQVFPSFPRSLAEIHWLQHLWGLVCLSLFLLPSCAPILEISPFAPIKPGACYAGHNNSKAEPSNSITNCILMSDPKVLFLNKNQRTSYIHKSIISESRYQKSQTTIFNQE